MKYNLVKHLGVGSSGDAYLLNNGKAIIIGKREDSFALFKAMFSKMQILDKHITEVKYPKIYQLISPNEEYPYGAVIEEYISGVELRKSISSLSNLQKVKIGKELSNFILQIHNISTEERKAEEIKINLSNVIFILHFSNFEIYELSTPKRSESSSLLSFLSVILPIPI